MFQPDLRLSLDVSVDTNADGPIDFELSLSNESAEPRIVDFPDGQRYDFAAFDAQGALVWQWSADMNFIMMLGREEIPAGETLVWTQRLEAGLPASAYRVVGTLTAMEPASVETTFEVSTR